MRENLIFARHELAELSQNLLCEFLIVHRQNQVSHVPVWHSEGAQQQCCVCACVCVCVCMCVCVCVCVCVYMWSNIN